jgi:hypothetical protein
MLLIHLARVLVAEVTNERASLSGAEVLVLVSFGIFGVLQGTQHFLSKFKGAPTGGSTTACGRIVRYSGSRSDPRVVTSSRSV